jgi:hypothetical protein
MGRDNAAPRSIVSSKTEYSFHEVGDTVSFELVKPPFVRDVSTRTPRYANEIYPRFYGGSHEVQLQWRRTLRQQRQRHRLHWSYLATREWFKLLLPPRRSLHPMV